MVNRKLKSLRAEKGLNQIDMANLLDISESTYNRKELGKREFTVSEACKISKIFGFPVDDIFFEAKVNINKTFLFNERR